MKGKYKAAIALLLALVLLPLALLLTLTHWCPRWQESGYRREPESHLMKARD